MGENLVESGSYVIAEWIDGTQLNGEILNMPRGEGDLIQLKVGRDVYAINPYSSGFKYLKKHRYQGEKK